MEFFLVGTDHVGHGKPKHEIFHFSNFYPFFFLFVFARRISSIPEEWVRGHFYLFFSFFILCIKATLRYQMTRRSPTR